MTSKQQKEPFNFWQDHSSHYLEMAYATDSIGCIDNYDGYGIKTGICGDTVEFFLKIHDGIIESVSFVANGCLNTVACANTVVSLVENKSVEQAWEITPEDVIDYLETLPLSHHHCAELVVGTFYIALNSFRKNQATFQTTK
jgi:nitrogen fixation NifU-like protein